MSADAQGAMGRTKHVIAKWLRSRLAECTTCRDCEASVGPWDECCANCGRGNPARVASSATVAIAVIVGLVLIGVLATTNI